MLAARGIEHLNTKAFRELVRSDTDLGITDHDLEDEAYMVRVRQRIRYKVTMLQGLKRERKPKEVSHPPFLTVI